MLTASLPGETVATLRDRVNDRSEGTVVSTDQLHIDLTSDEASIGVNGITLPVTTEGVMALGSYFGVPTSFLDKIEPDEREWIINARKERLPGTLSVRYTDEGITGAYTPNQRIINPSRLVDVAARVISPEAPVVGLIDTVDDIVFDTIVPHGFDRGIVTVPEQVDLPDEVLDLLDDPTVRRVGDTTRGGIRIGYDKKRNLAPFVQPFSYRLFCTNGMETRSDGLRVEARGAQSVDDVLAELEGMAEAAFSAVEAQINAMYDLRANRVQNPERLIHRLGTEHGLPTRTIDQLVAAAPTLGDEPTEFDVVQLITNAANAGADNPRRFNARRTLQTVGGRIVVQHQERCGHCNAKIV
jgi:hypothetical protein